MRAPSVSSAALIIALSRYLRRTKAFPSSRFLRQELRQQR